MSAIDTRKRINNADVLKLQCMEECKSYDGHESPEGCELLSPVSIRNEFIQGYDQFVKGWMAKDLGQLLAMKMAFTSLAVEKYRSTDPLALQPEIVKVMNSETIEDFTTGMKKILPDLERSHGQMFQHVLGEACKRSSIACQYHEVTIEKSDQMIRIIAKNKHQQIIISEISMEPASKDFMIRTETIGLKGNQCEKILDRFEEALREYGITSSCKARSLKSQNPTQKNNFSKISNDLKRRFLRLKQHNHQQTI